MTQHADRAFVFLSAGHIRKLDVRQRAPSHLGCIVFFMAEQARQCHGRTLVGAIQEDYVAVNLVFSRYRQRGAEVVQLNHPRTFGQGFVLLGLLDSIGYDPDLPIDSPPNDVLLSRDVTGSAGVEAFETSTST